MLVSEDCSYESPGITPSSCVAEPVCIIRRKLCDEATGLWNLSGF